MNIESKLVLNRVLLSNLEVANVDNENLGPYKRLADSAQIFESVYETEFILHNEDLFGYGQEEILKIISYDENSFLYTFDDNAKYKLFFIKDADLSRSIVIAPNSEMQIQLTDMVAVLVPNYLPIDLYGGVEALFYIQFK